MRIKINKEQLKKIEKNFEYMSNQIEFEGENVSYNCMNRIKNIINNRKSILIEDLFEIER